jgi:hypothetical protein
MQPFGLPIGKLKLNKIFWIAPATANYHFKWIQSGQVLAETDHHLTRNSETCLQTIFAWKEAVYDAHGYTVLHVDVITILPTTTPLTLVTQLAPLAPIPLPRSKPIPIPPARTLPFKVVIQSSIPLPAPTPSLFAC